MTEFFKHLIHEFERPLGNPVLVFSVILFIILLAPIILRRINIPGIIGLIISGVIIGPHGLNVLEKNSAIDLFSTIGLLYIMFIAGLELDMNEFKANRNKSLLFGVYTFIFPLSIGFPVCYYLLGYDFNASLLTASMFATHTLVAYPIVSRLGVSKNQAVAITVGGTILTDTAVLIILAVLVGNSGGSLTQQFWVKLVLSLTIFTIIMFTVVPYVARWFFRKLESEKHSHYIFVLAVVFFAAFLAEIAGVEPIIGAFVAGLALNKLIPHSSALMNRIEFIGNSLFIPFFLISVGMLVNIQVILTGPGAIIVALVLSAVALFGKWIAAVATQYSLRYSKSQRGIIFGLSGAHAAATLAVILVGYNAGILDETILNGTIILILITCLFATFVTEKAAKRLVLESADESAPQELLQGINNEQILLPIGNLADIERLLEFAILVREKKGANPVSILSVVSNNVEAEINIIKARNKLEKFVKQASASETNVNVITTIDHNIASGIARISREIMADVIVVGWPHRPGLVDRLVGEMIDNLLLLTNKSIMVFHIQRPLPLHKRIMIAAPPLAEHEKGFDLWFQKTAKLAQELTIPVTLYSNSDTAKAIEKICHYKKVTVTIDSQLFEDWDDFLVLAKNIHEEDMIVLISARKGAASHFPFLDKLPFKLEKHFASNTRLVIYPQQYTQDGLSERYEDFSTEQLSKGIEKVQEIGKGIGKIFKRDGGI